jgi:hypothetical protein
MPPITALTRSCLFAVCACQALFRNFDVAFWCYRYVYFLPFEVKTEREIISFKHWYCRRFCLFALSEQIYQLRGFIHLYSLYKTCSVCQNILSAYKMFELVSGGFMGKGRDLIGTRFGSLLVVSRYVGSTNNGYIGAIWNCVCDCGGSTVSASTHLVSGKRTSCGCGKTKNVSTYRISQREDLSGRIYGVLTVLSICDKTDAKGRFSYWSCRCVCGGIRLVGRTHLLNGKHYKCSCSRKKTGPLLFDPVARTDFGQKNMGSKNPIGEFFGGSVGKRGYVLGKVWDGHELRRVKEHTFVMELHLGRKLLRNEEIHHVNGIKTDNRLENLELFANSSEHLRSAHSNRKPRN